MFERCGNICWDFNIVLLIQMWILHRYAAKYIIIKAADDSDYISINIIHIRTMPCLLTSSILFYFLIFREREREREREGCAAVVTVGHVARGVLAVVVHTTDNWQSVWMQYVIKGYTDIHSYTIHVSQCRGRTPRKVRSLWHVCCKESSHLLSHLRGTSARMSECQQEVENLARSFVLWDCDSTLIILIYILYKPDSKIISFSVAK